MYFDFEDRYDDYQPVGGTLRRWDGVLISVGVHVVFVVVLLFAPVLPIFQPDPAAQAESIPPEPERERPRFVYVQPRVDLESKQAPRLSEESDKNRMASAERASPTPRNPLPYARGNSTNRVESTPEERAKGEGPDPEPNTEPPAPDIVERVPSSATSDRAPLPTPEARPRPPQGGSLGEALRNLQKYVDKESFNNDQGQAQNLGPLQFDTKGVEFGPWIRRFVAQVRRNWFVPMAAMSLRGRVVLTFYVHRNGALTDVQIIQASSVESFNLAARNALLASNPTEPLPPEYPDDRAFFTVTFYYNESP
jgi:TonB family protein